MRNFPKGIVPCFKYAITKTMNAGMRVDELMMATTTIASIIMKYLGYVAISLTSIINYRQACNLGIY